MTIPLTLPINEIPIACELTDANLAARRETISHTLWSQVEAKKALPDGYAFRFPNAEGMPQALLSFIQAERQCCAFFQMELVFAPGNGPIWLHLRGGDGVKEFIETELNI